MLNGSRGRYGTVMRARTDREEFCMGAMDVMGTVMGPLTLSLERPSCHCLSHIKYPTRKSEAIPLIRLDQVFGEPSTHKVQWMHRYGRHWTGFGRLEGYDVGINYNWLTESCKLSKFKISEKPKIHSQYLCKSKIFHNPSLSACAFSCLKGWWRLWSKQWHKCQLYDHRALVNPYPLKYSAAADWIN